MKRSAKRNQLYYRQAPLRTFQARAAREKGAPVYRVDTTGTKQNVKLYAICHKDKKQLERGDDISLGFSPLQPCDPAEAWTPIFVVAPAAKGRRAAMPEFMQSDS